MGLCSGFKALGWFPGNRKVEDLGGVGPGEVLPRFIGPDDPLKVVSIMAVTRSGEERDRLRPLAFDGSARGTAVRGRALEALWLLFRTAATKPCRSTASPEFFDFSVHIRVMFIPTIVWYVCDMSKKPKVCR